MSIKLQTRLTRQIDLLPLNVLGEPITIIGAGAVGSWTALTLAKMGFANLTVWDDDVVDDENMNCSLYRPVDIGQKKVYALFGLIQQFCEIEIRTFMAKYTTGVFPGIVISAVDSMAVRRQIWSNHAGRSATTKVVIDPRMGAETALLYVMNPLDERDDASYVKTLYSDDDAVREPCTRKATAYCALPLSGLVAAQVKSVVTGQPYSRITQWDIPKGALQSWQK